MGIYDTSGAFNVAVNDTTGKGRYSASGALRVTLVSGTSYVGLYAADGSVNVIIDPSGQGLYHPSGALRGVSADSLTRGLYAPNGAYYFAGLFSPLNLFSAGEQGVWYDPSDLSTMFQNSAGTTPVTGLEQPVGLLLDKSKGLVLGPELVTNGSFATDTDWNKGTGWSIASGVATKTAGTAADLVQNTGSSFLNRYIRIRITITRTAGALKIYPGGWSFYDVPAASGTYEYNFAATNLSTGSILYISADAAFAGTVDEISIKPIQGNHASQATSASRPVLSARYNLLTYSEDVSNAAWTKLNTSASSAIHPNPLGGSTANLVAADTVIGAHACSFSFAFVSGVSYTFSIAVKKGSGATAPDWVQLTFPQAAFGTGQYANFNLSTGAAGTTAGGTASISSLGSGWYRLTFTATATGAATSTVGVAFNNNSDSSGRVPLYADVTTSNFFAWGADLRVTNDGVGIPAYQRVGAATAGSSTAAGTADYDSTGFPPYLRFDGTDDSMATAAIDFTATDKVSFFAGVRKLSDTPYLIPLEFSANINLNSGTFYFAGGTTTATGPNYNVGSRGTAANNGNQAVVSTASFAAPITNVVTARHDIAGDLSALRINGVANGTNATGDKGSGNFGNYPLYIGARGSISNWLNGRLYSLIVRGAASTAGQIADTEGWVNGKTKAY